MGVDIACPRCPHPVSTSGCVLVRRERRVPRGELLRDHGTLFPVPAREHPHQSRSSRARVLLPVPDEVVPDAGLSLKISSRVDLVPSSTTPPVLLGTDRLKLVERSEEHTSELQSRFDLV